jgi:large subunit ribosomal protein L24
MFMKKKFSTSWKGSKSPRKQRKYLYNAPLHLRGNFLNVHLSKELAAKYGIKKLRARVGDKVRVLRGKYRATEGKIDLVSLKKGTIKMTGVEVSKKDGSKAKVPIHASNLLIIDLNTDDKLRLPQKEKKAQKEPKDKKEKA